MTTLEELRDIPRFCFKCGHLLRYYDFLISASIRQKSEICKEEILEEIWENPIFVLLCCRCYREEYSPMRCQKCGIGIGRLSSIRSLCMSCFSEEIIMGIKNEKICYNED